MRRTRGRGRDENARTYDVLVVGAGAGGSLAAYRLAQAGAKVLLLERGPRFDPARDYHVDAPDWEFHEPFERHVPDTVLATERTPPAGFDHLRTNLEESPSRRSFRYPRACGVGGSTLRYHAEAHRFPPHAFAMRSRFGVDTDWPIAYPQLAPYYERVERLLGVAGESNPLFPGPTSYPNPPHPLSPASQRVACGCSALGLSLRANSVAILSQPLEGRLPCTYCKMCSHGCMVGDKSSTDVAVVPLAEKTGNLHLKTNAVVLRLVAGANGEVIGVHAVDATTGRDTMYRGRIVILAAGAIETPRLLLNSSSPGFPDGLGNRSGLVGRYLMENLYVCVLFLFPDKVDSYRGLPIDSKAWDHAVPRPDRGQPRGFTLASLGAPDYLQGPAKFALHVAPGFGRRHREFVEKYFGAHCMLYALAEQGPRASNRVTLDRVEKDPFGVPKARVDTGPSIEDCEMLAGMLGLCNEVAEASGAERVLGRFTAYDVSRATHACGTARMGFGEDDSVVDSFCRVHGMKNLYITDASVLPTQGCGASPSLTIQALALRAAEHILEASSG